MGGSQTSVLNVRAKTGEVADYHHDAALPGKPLHLLLIGGGLALVCLGLIVAIVYKTWFAATLDETTGKTMLALLSPFYVGGVFVFSYGYELYDFWRAVRLTAIVVFLTAAAVVIVAVLFVLLTGGGKSDSSSSKSSSKASTSSGASAAPLSALSTAAGNTTSTGSTVSFDPIFIGGATHTVTREVIREVPATPPEARAVRCPHCQRSYVPRDNQYMCPGCSAATPASLVAESENAA